MSRTTLRPPPRPARALLAALAGTLALGVTACSDDGAADPAPTPSASQTSATSSPTESTSSTDPAESSGSVTPTATGDAVAPAAGPLLQVASSSLHAPDGWTADDAISEDQAGASGPEGTGTVGLIDFESIGGGGTPLDQQYDAAAAALPGDAKVTRMPDVTLGSDATPAVHLSYTVAGDPDSHDVVVTERAGRSITINLDLSPEALKTDPEVVASVLASFEWV